MKLSMCEFFKKSLDILGTENFGRWVLKLMTCKIKAI